MQISIAMQLHCIRGSFSTVVSDSQLAATADARTEREKERSEIDSLSLSLSGDPSKKFPELQSYPLSLSVANFSPSGLCIRASTYLPFKSLIRDFSPLKRCRMASSSLPNVQFCASPLFFEMARTRLTLQTSPLTVTPSGREKSVTVSGVSL